MDISVIWQIIAVVGVVFFSMTLHEIMHGLVAYRLGDHTAKLHGRLTLNPLKHIDPFMTIILPVLLAVAGGPIFGGAKPVPVNQFALKRGELDMALVSLAGPMTNFLLAFIFFAVFAVSGETINTITGSLLLLIVQINLGFFLFNIIPLPPLDGSRVLYAFAPESVQNVMQQVERYGIFVVFGVVIFAQQALFAYMVGGSQAIIHLFTILFGTV